MKISVMMPTYNDAESIVEALDSVLCQTYRDFEIIIINDGSTDQTEQVVNQYRKQHQAPIKYLHQTNQDQLNALLNGSKLISGQLVFVLHSDDLLPSDDFFERTVNYFKQHPDTEAIIGGLEIINGQDQITGLWPAGKYWNHRQVAARLLLNDGCNIYGDVTVQKTKVFRDQTKRNYLTWNTPFWIDFDNEARPLKVDNVDFTLLKYRIHGDNYIDNQIGKFNALNGELRVITQLAQRFRPILPLVQRFIYQLLRKPGVRKLKFFNYYRPILGAGKLSNRQTYRLLKKAINKVYGRTLQNIYLEALLAFYQQNAERQIVVNFQDEPIYQGKDIRLFTKQLFTEQLDELYYNMFRQMQRGFHMIITNDVAKARDLCKFLNINPIIKQGDDQ